MEKKGQGSTVNFVSIGESRNTYVRDSDINIENSGDVSIETYADNRKYELYLQVGQEKKEDVKTFEEILGKVDSARNKLGLLEDAIAETAEELTEGKARSYRGGYEFVKKVAEAGNEIARQEVHEGGHVGFLFNEYLLKEAKKKSKSRKKRVRLDGLKDLDIIIQMAEEQNSAPYRMKGDVYRKLGDDTAAINSYSEAIRVNPDDDIAIKNIDKLTRPERLVKQAKKFHKKGKFRQELETYYSLRGSRIAKFEPTSDIDETITDLEENIEDLVATRKANKKLKYTRAAVFGMKFGFLGAFFGQAVHAAATGHVEYHDNWFKDFGAYWRDLVWEGGFGLNPEDRIGTVELSADEEGNLSEPICGTSDGPKYYEDMSECDGKILTEELAVSRDRETYYYGKLNGEGEYINPLIGVPADGTPVEYSYHKSGPGKGSFILDISKPDKVGAGIRGAAVRAPLQVFGAFAWVFSMDHRQERRNRKKKKEAESLETVVETVSESEYDMYLGLLQEHKELVELNPRDHLAWNRVGHYHYMLNEHREALVSFEEANGLKPGNEFYLHNLGVVNTRLGKYELGFDYLKRAYALDPSYHTKQALNHARTLMAKHGSDIDLDEFFDRLNEEE